VWAYQLLTLTIVIDALLLRRFFGHRAEAQRALEVQRSRAGPDTS
jgi:hypothetical protein